MSANTTTLVDIWIQDHRSGIERCIERAIVRIEADHTFRLPRSITERQNAFEEWIGAYRLRLAPAIDEEWHREFPGIARKQSPNFIATLVGELVWPRVESYLRAKAIRALATGWALDHLGDAVWLDDPRFQANKWTVPVRIRGHDETVGVIVLDATGEVISEKSITKKALLGIARDRKLSAVSTASR